MRETHRNARSSIWYVLVISLIVASLTWWWFTQRIETLDSQIELHERQ